MEAKAIVRNVGHRAAKRSRVRAYLSPTKRRTRSSIRLDGAQKIGRLRPGKRRRVTLRTTVPVGPKGSRFLVVCADDAQRVRERREGNNCATGATRTTVTVQPVTTADLIEADERDGRVSTDQAILYEVYGAFADPRLPTRYEGGDDSFDSGTEAARDAASAWPGLSAKTRHQLIPFFQPPIYRSSWYAKRLAEQRSTSSSLTVQKTGDEELDCAGEPVSGGGSPPGPSPPLWAKGWRTRSAVGGKVKIWWCRDDKNGPARAAVWTKALEDRNVWKKLTALMGRAPLSDAGSHPTEQEGVVWGDGGDGALDIYLDSNVYLKSRLTTLAYPPGCSERPAFIVDQGYHDYEWPSRAEVAHELFHTIQLAFKRHECESLAAAHIDEATAQWSMHYAFPGDDDEHSSNPEYESMISSPRAYFNALGGGSYDHWVFWLYVQRKLGAGRVRALYQALGSKDVVPAIDAALPGGIDRQWPRFSRHGWNQPPLQAGETFRNWDHVFAVPLAGDNAPVEDVFIGLDGKAKATYPVDVNLGARTRTYAPFEVADDDVRQIEVENPLAGRPIAHLEALITLKDGRTRTEDLSTRSSFTLCRKNANEAVESFVLIASNTSLARQPTSGTVKVTARNQCEEFPQRWTGTAKGTITDSSTSDGSSAQESWSSTLTLERTYQGNGTASYDLTNAHVDWKYSATHTDSSGTCTYSGSKSYDKDRTIGFGMNIWDWDDTSLADEYDLNLALGGEFAHVDGLCTQYGKTYEDDTDHYPIMNIVDEAEASGEPWTPGSKALSGSETYTSRSEPDVTVRWQWNLAAQ